MCRFASGLPYMSKPCALIGYLMGNMLQKSSYSPIFELA